MTPLVIDDQIKQKISDLKKEAEENPVNIHELFRTLGNSDMAVGNRANHVIEIPFGYRVVFSHEEQPKVGMCRHISISQKRGRTPDVAACSVILEEFGFDGPCKIWEEPVDAHHVAINFIQPIHHT